MEATHYGNDATGAKPSTAPVIEARGLCKTFKLSAKQQRIERSAQRVRVAVDDLTLRAYPGEIYGLLGPNGAGKTTTLRMLATLIKPDVGDATIASHSITAAPTQVRATVGFLTSELKLEDFFTPDYLFGFFSTLHNVEPSIATQRKEALFKRFGIDEFAQVKVSNLSTGMKQKTSLAISLVHNPDIIIFDEPTNGLDVITAKVVTDYLEELKAQGKSIILSTHIFTLAEKLCDRVGIIVGGRMIREGTLDEVCEGRDLEQVFFDLYVEINGEVA